jgi:alpha-ketoglutarate-dependent taurine dioxygenase
MFAMQEYQGKIAVADAAFVWGNDLDRLFRVIERQFKDFNNNGFYPHPDEVAMREEFREIGTLRRLTEALQRLDANGIVLRNLGLAGLPEERRNAALYALTLMLGYPTSTDQRTGRVAWDVKARPAGGNDTRFVTFSERVGSADMHTDSSFYPMPEEHFILYVVRAAECAGGHSLLVDGESIHAALQHTAAGRAAYALLRETPVPFRVPSVYAANDESVEYHVAPVFGAPRRAGDRFTLRWRYDAIRKGLAGCPSMSSPALLDALEIMNDVAEEGAARFREQLPTDTLMICDNHRMLHGRTTYTDEQRHLIRIRMSAVPNAQRVGPSGVVQD